MEGRDEDPMTLYQRFQNSFHQIANKDTAPFSQKPEDGLADPNGGGAGGGAFFPGGAAGGPVGPPGANSDYNPDSPFFPFGQNPRGPGQQQPPPGYDILSLTMYNVFILCIQPRTALLLWTRVS